MRRIRFAVLTICILAAPFVTEAQQTENVRRIEFLSAPSLSPANVDAFRKVLREHGYVDGQNLLIEWRSAEGRDERLPALAAELVRLKVEVIVTQGTAAAPAARNATALTPIAFTFVADPVGLGLIASFSRPGGTITGVSSFALDLTSKRLELLKEAIPSLKSVALLTNPANPVSASSISEAHTAARQLGLDVRLVEVRDPAELEPALVSISRERAMAVALVPGSFLFQYQHKIAELAMKGRVPVLGCNSLLAENTLISYGPDVGEIVRRAANHVAKILKGARPGDNPG